jgi:hypothetical protein
MGGGVTDHYFGEVIIPTNDLDTRTPARLRFPVGTPADAWFGYQWRVDSSLPPDRFVLQGVDRAGRPFRLVVLFEEGP